MRRPYLRALSAGLVPLAVLAACGDDAATGRDGPTTTASTTAPTGAPLGADAVIDPGDGGRYAPRLDPADFVDVIDNPYLPLLVGSRWVYEGDSDGRPERIEVVVTDERRRIDGIVATVVRDTVHVDGELVEDTYDWFAQDREGNVWYLGEASNDYEGGVNISREGSWEHGVDGAIGGIVMLADPTVGDAYRQEFLAGEAEDLGEVIKVGETLTTGLDTYTDVIVTEDWTPLEPEVVEHKWYAPGIGKVYGTHERGPSGTIELVSFTPGAGR